MTVPSAAPQHAAPARWRDDARAFVGVVVASVLLGAPAGLVWAAVAPRYTISIDKDGATFPNLESTKAFVGADGSYLVAMLVMGLVCGVLAWFFARRGGPFTVLALVVGGVLAALIAQSVGLRPHTHEAVQALQSGSPFRGNLDLYLGKRDTTTGTVALRSGGWAAVAWPVGAMMSFLLFAFQRPEELD